ncbi:MAG: DNA repair protein RecN [Bryobacteraceae bacterium]
MLVELVVENYAVVERLRVRFHRGFNLLTGETGSGKSIVVDALGLLFGGRASADMIRSGADRARVSGIFEAPADAEFRALLDGAGVEIEEDEILIEREILPGGKSRAFVANRPATASLLKEMAPWLGDIHGQHEQQRLFSAEAQLDLLDAFAGSRELVERTGGIYGQWRACARELEELERSEQEKLRLQDLWSFQRREIEDAELKPGEDAELENERRILQNMARLQESANAAYAALYEAPESAIAGLKIALRRIEELCRIDASVQEIAETLRPAQFAAEEAAHALRGYLGKLEADPARIEEVEARLALIDKLKRKYGASVEEVLAFLCEVRSNLEALETASERRTALEAEQARLRDEYGSAAAKLTAHRRGAAERLARQVETELEELAMGRTRLRIDVTAAAPSVSGSDAVTFLVSTNAGEEPKPLGKVASGGELSRIALALKTCITAVAAPAAAGEVPRTLVFDEVDAGIGGSAAVTVGRKLKELACGNQVLCVTHLAQIAGFGDHHYLVAKREIKNRTVATIEEIEGEARVREIGRMLSGDHLTPEALKHAAQLIRG